MLPRTKYQRPWCHHHYDLVSVIFQTWYFKWEPGLVTLPTFIIFSRDSSQAIYVFFATNVDNVKSTEVINWVWYSFKQMEKSSLYGLYLLVKNDKKNISTHCLLAPKIVLWLLVIMACSLFSTKWLHFSRLSGLALDVPEISKQW